MLMILSNRDLQSRPGARPIRTRATNYVAESLQQLLIIGTAPLLFRMIRGQWDADAFCTFRRFFIWVDINV